MTLAVVFTEYQLIQVQALINFYSIKDVTLIIIEAGRIKDWLIDHHLYLNVIRHDDGEKIRSNRVKKKYIVDNDERLSALINKEVDLMIGAQDENTVFAIIKSIADPKKYWNIEDGIANYYERGLNFKMGILFKKLLFRYIYGHDLDIQYRHGFKGADKKFRMATNIANENDNVVCISAIVKDYLIGKANKLLLTDRFSQDYNKFDRLVITDLAHFRKNSDSQQSDKSISKCYKFHPREIIPEDIGVHYMTEKIPLDMVPFLYKDLKEIEFQVMSSSYLNLKMMDPDLEIIDNIERDTKLNKYLLSKYDLYFDNK